MAPVAAFSAPLTQPVLRAPTTGRQLFFFSGFWLRGCRHFHHACCLGFSRQPSFSPATPSEGRESRLTTTTTLRVVQYDPSPLLHPEFAAGPFGPFFLRFAPPIPPVIDRVNSGILEPPIFRPANTRAALPAYPRYAADGFEVPVHEEHHAARDLEIFPYRYLQLPRDGSTRTYDDK